jgi:uncharacterized protein involved in exopolysaccharide biosynthesis
MNLQRIQSVPSQQFRSVDGGPVVPPPSSGPVGPGSQDQPLFRLNLLRALQLHRRLALGIALGCLLLAVAYVVKAWPVYLAQSQIYVQPVQTKVMASGPDSSFANNSAAYDSFVQQQVESAANPDVLINALHKLKPGTWQRSGESEQAAAARLGGAIEVARVGTSYEVAITAKAKNAELAAQMSNAVATSIVERASGEGNAGNVQRIAVLREERDRIQNELTSDYSEQSALNKQLGMAAVGTEAPDLIDSDIGKTREELIKAQTDHDEAAARFSAMGAGKGESSAAIDAEADDMVAADAGLTSMKTSLNSRRATLITQMSNLTPNNPEYKQDAAELAKINGNLDSMMKDLRGKAAARIQEKLRTDLERTAGVESRLNGQLRQLASTAASATPKLQRASDLATDIARLRARFTTVDEQLHNLMLEDSAPGAVHLSVTAVPPLRPAVAGILKKALPLALGGLLLGLLAASIVNYLDPRVYIGADIEQTLGFAAMAVVPDFDEVSEEVSAEHLLRLASAIEHARKQGNLTSCIFTGTAAGVGVTTLATRVRDVLEAMGRPTVLLDSSGTPPPPSRASSQNGASGAAASQRGSRSTALLRKVTAETETRQESLVLTDTAPLPISAETEYLARFVDCAIVVVESGTTTRAQLLAALNTLQRLDVAAVGFVLNRVKLAQADPAFRRSVQDIDEHHRTLSMSTVRRTERTSQVAEELLPDPKELPRQSSVSENSTLKASEPETSGLAARRSTLAEAKQAAPKWSTAAPVKPWLPQPATPVDVDSPWWLSDAHSSAAAAPSRAEKPSEPAPPAQPKPELHSRAKSLQTWEDASSWSDDFTRLRIGDAAPVAAAEAATIFTQEAASIAAARVVPMPIAETAPMVMERAAPVAASRVDSMPVAQAAPIFTEEAAAVAAAESVQDAALQREEEKIPFEHPSRLNPLRGLLFSLGLKNLGKTRNAAQLEEKSALPAENEPERTVIARGFTPFAEPVPVVATALVPIVVAEPVSIAVEVEAVPVVVAEQVSVVAAEAVPVAAPAVETKVASEPQREVTTLPEFLPPREFVPMRETAADYDELQTLPSRRGQYKRRG